MAQLHLFWPTDSGGYHLETTPAGSGRTTAESYDAQTWIVSNRGRPQSVDCMKIHGLIRRLAEWRRDKDHKPRPANAKGALDFVKNYGFLKAEHDSREDVAFIAHQIRVARALVRVIDRKDWPTIERWASDNASIIKLAPDFEYIESEDRKTLFFSPTTLIGAIFLQALQDVANATQFVTCDRPGCPEWFAVGPGSGRRDTAKYCSPKCQKAHYYLKGKRP